MFTSNAVLVSLSVLGAASGALRPTFINAAYLWWLPEEKAAGQVRALSVAGCIALEGYYLYHLYNVCRITKGLFVLLEK